MNQTTTKPGRISQLIEAVENLAEVQPTQAKAKAVGKSKIGSRALKKHLKYIVPEMRLALIKEPGLKPKAITSAEDLDKFIEPLKFYSDFVPKQHMCPSSCPSRLGPEFEFFCAT